MNELGNVAKNPVKGARTTLRIVEALRDLEGAGVTELANHLDMPKSSVHNYLSTLEQEEYVVKDGRAYHVGLRFLNLGSFARHRRQIYAIAQEEVNNLAAETGELANLMVEEHGRGIYIYRETGDQAVNVDAYTGHRVHMHNTALGKAMLAHFPEVYVEEIIEQHGMHRTTANTITTSDELLEELEQIRDRGLAFDREERLKGLQCVAAPITDTDDIAVGAISVSGPTSRMQGERLESEIPDLLSKATNVIELNITYA